MSATDLKLQLLELCKAEIGHTLTQAQAALPPRQFDAFRKLVLDHFNGVFRPQLYHIFKVTDGAGPYGRASGNLSKEGGCP